MTRGDDVGELDARDVDAEATWVTFDAETSRDEERSNFLSERMTDDDDATAARFDARDGGFDGNGDALDVTCSVRGDSELERVRERLASAEANALRATEALDAERAGRERERRRFTALLRAKGVDDARDASSEDGGEGDGGGWGRES
ncbi:unnamed product [Ostreococcus tauri]|uniref:Unnamed product n=1 Tax=Ostreococcus tauri TaxID=70448 RepID=A0A098E626_OSTTA|nr:unnamed product [Ostreococcus tauri]CEG02085.1 unnamed product [Ostreococcus tauri]|eukprot:XP_022841342.1 unnamed product [Ostreococcus tauri]